MKKPELLAPAGDRESLEAAIAFGADAVYIGGSLLQLRAKKAGFSDDDLRDAVKYAHERGVKVYVTVNSFAFNDEIPLAGQYAKKLYSFGVDAAIISDIGVMSEFHRCCPELDIHVSTQANTMNYAAARVYYEMGAKRIVLARELSIDEIKKLRANIPEELELEAFVHGAMCMSHSGRCILSSWFVNRSGNRGECSQPCRWNYALVEEKRPGEYFPIIEEEDATTVLSSHDLNCIGILDELRGAGVKSFKIEGRMKTAYYVATCVNAYRKALDGTDTIEHCREELNAIKHRPYNTGFYYGEVAKNHNNSGEYTQDAVFIANVLDCSDSVATLRQRNRFLVGDTLEVLSPHTSGLSFKVTKIITEDGGERDSAPHPNEIVRVPCDIELHAGDFLRRRGGQ